MKSEQSRLTVIMIFCLCFCGAILFRSVSLQIVQDSRLAGLAKRQFQSRLLLSPKRGAILDRNGEPLAVNSEAHSLAANPNKVKNARELARLLSKALELPVSRISEKLKESREFVWIKRHLTESELARLKRLRLLDSAGDLQEGLWMVRENRRIYPHGELAAHLLGSVNLDSEGLEGVELWANEQLQGKVASVSAIRDALGRPTFIDAVAVKELKDGEDIKLTIDASLQFSVEQELKAAVSRTGAKSGTVVVMNAETGELLSVANEPTFNPNLKGIASDKRRNRAFTDGYEPGSTLKAVLLAGAIKNGATLNDQLFGERGTFLVQGKRISEAESHEKFEWVSLKKMIQVSSNVVAAKLALKLGGEKYLKTLEEFGFGAKSGSEFPGEISGKVPPKQGIQPLTTANIGFGQGILTTPIQVIRAYAAFANGGLLPVPKTRIADSGESLDPEKTPQKPVAFKRVMTREQAQTVVEALESVTQKGGTGGAAELPGYFIAGKTGTAQTVDSETGRYSKTRYIPSFVGFASRAEPKIVILALLDDPKGKYYAADTAAPLFREVLSAVVSRYSIPADQSTFTNPTKLVQRAPTQRPETIDDKLKTSLSKVLTSDPTVMPKLTGLTAREALEALSGTGLEVEIKGHGVVAAQSPQAGSAISKLTSVRIQLVEP